jgi:hypothetical protein
LTLDREEDPRCPRCGTPLKIETVKVPVYLDHMQMVDGKLEETQVLARYDEHQEVSDCPRCQGAY